MEKIRNLSKSAGKTVSVACVGILFAVLFLLFLGGFDFYGAAGFVYSHMGSLERIFLCGLAVGAFALFYVFVGKVLGGLRKKNVKYIVAGCCVLALALQMYFLFYVQSTYKWDSGFVIGAAASLTETGTVAEQAYYYLSVYPNQNTFVCITAMLIKLSDLLGISVGARPLVFNVFNTICMDLSVVLSVLFIKRRKPDLSAKQLARIVIILLCNPFLYLGVSYYYTITLSLPLTMGFLYLAAGKKRNDFISWILAGILLGIGYELRATAIILVIALVFTELRKWMEEQNGNRLIGLAVIVLTALVVATGISKIQQRYIGIDTTDTAFPATHWVMMSMTMPGSHNAEDEAYTASFATKEEKKEAVAARIEEKWDVMTLRDYAVLVKTKVQNTFGNGMNGYEVFLTDALRTDGIYEYVFGGHNDLAVLWQQGYYLFVMLGILLYAGKWICHVIKGEKEDTWGFCLLLILFGAVLFYVLWEASEQYSVPFMMIMNCIGLVGITEGVSGKEVRKKRVDKAAVYGGVVLALAVLIWGIARISLFTANSYLQSETVASQILANTSYRVDDGKELVQSIRLSKPFNRIIIQWRNPDMEESTATYRAELRKADGTVLYAADINAAGTGYNGAGIYDFETAFPETDGYEIAVYKTGGEADHDLEFVIYDMPGYIPYSMGNLTLADGSKTEQLQASLLFSVSEEKTEPYTTVKKYVFFVSITFILFLFMAFWCKLRVVCFTEEEP